MKSFMSRLTPIFGGVLLAFFAFCLLSDSVISGAVITTAILPCAMLFCLLRDLRQRWFYLAFTLPRGRQRVVCAYYRLHLMLLLVPLLTAFLVEAIRSYSTGDGETPTALLRMLLMCFAVEMLILSFLLPLLLGGFERRKRCIWLTLAATLLYAGGLSAFILLVERADALLESNFNVALAWGFGLASAAACVMYIASYLLAVSIMKKKELVR